MTPSILSKAEEGWYEYWDRNSRHTEQTYLTPDTNGIIKEYLRQQLTSAITEVLGAVRLEKKTFPERESDDYDAGYAIAVAEQNRLIEGILKELN